MKRVLIAITAVTMTIMTSCNAPGTSSDVDLPEEQSDEGRNLTEEDNTEVNNKATMEEKYLDAEEEVIKDTLKRP